MKKYFRYLWICKWFLFFDLFEFDGKDGKIVFLFCTEFPCSTLYLSVVGPILFEEIADNVFTYFIFFPFFFGVFYSASFIDTNHTDVRIIWDKKLSIIQWSLYDILNKFYLKYYESSWSLEWLFVVVNHCIDKMNFNGLFTIFGPILDE